MKTTTLTLIKTFLLFCLSLPLQAQFLPCSFIAVPDSSMNGTVHFTVNPAAGPHLVWDFGDNTTGNGSAVVHTYNSVGPFYVCLTEYDSSGNILCNFCDTVFPFGNPGSCSFTFVPDPHDSLGLIFTGSGTGTSTVTWVFGDGINGTGNNPTHHYPGAGTYNVCMTTISSSGTACTSCFPVHIAGGSSTICSFTSSTTAAGVYVFSTNAFPGSIINWSFGDGTAGHGTTVTHTYNGIGAYLVCMTEVDSIGNILCTYCDSVGVNTNPAPNCQFNYSASIGNYLDIHFTSNPGSHAGTMTWDFGDGSTGSGSTITHSYATTGIYNVCNSFLDSSGTSICHSCQLVNVHVPNQNLCHANFQAVSLGLIGYYIDLSTVDPATATYSWDFGDGNSSTLRFPQHQYSALGTYNVCLTVTDSNCSDQFCAPLHVDTTINNPVFCNAYFVKLQIAPYQLTVVNMASGINLFFNWDFGDGTTSTQQYPSHTYANIGTYVLCLNVTGGGCTSTYCDTVSVDSSGHIYRMSSTAFTINVVSPDQLTGINDVPAAKFFSIYPNPAAEILNVQINAIGTSQYRVLNLNGKEVLSGSFSSEYNTLKTSKMESGFYMLEITRTDGVKNYQKFIKQ